MPAKLYPIYKRVRPRLTIDTEDIVYIEDDKDIVIEVEVILKELGETLYANARKYFLSAN